ncbi:MAG TPA: histidine kinase [Steroidobacteraceae bacterium]|nr:histidine kinase [Steroidobacteraceae bacterium]
MAEIEHPALPDYSRGLRPRQFYLIVGLFWLYVTLSNVLFAYGMRAGISKVTNAPLFAPWDARVMQHVVLLPFLLVAYWTSLRVQWRPLLVAVPLQLTLGSLFAAVAYPAMILSEWTMGNAEWHRQHMKHVSDMFMLEPDDFSMWLASFVNFIPCYGFGLALVTGIALYMRFRNSELRVAALEREWSAARLSALRMQLSPHTLFNLLHTIRGYIEWDPKGAQSMVVQLADLLRRLLSAGERDFVRLADELQFARLYLELQQRRFSDRLTVELPDVRDVPSVWVPSLILQPLVENAVIHGLAGHQGPVVVRVSAKTSGDMVVLQVSNTTADNKTAGEDGIGISNVRERLAVQFEGRAALTTHSKRAQWISEITMPQIAGSPERRSAKQAAPLVGA